jgi:glutathione S-transferase
LTLEATADGILDAALLMVYETRLRPDSMQMPEIVDGQWSKIARSLAVLEDRWTAYLAGPLCMGQIALGCALGYLDFRHSARGWQDHAPQLAGWHDKLAIRESLIATAPPK